MPVNPNDWLLLCSLPRVGPKTLQRLLAHFSCAAAVLDAQPSLLRALGMPAEALAMLALHRQDAAASPLRGYLDRVQHWLQDSRNQLLCLEDAAYPPLLKQIADPPPLLYVRGDLDLLSLPQVAIVGSRYASRQGVESAASFAGQLLANGLIPTSGMALGIDAAAHEGALVAQGPTLAVLGTGLDRIYPARHCGLAEAIIEQGGALVSELPLGTPPRAQNFPRRNRIISGLSLGVLVVEAALKSGSLITARYALEQGREVFALPGSIHNPMSKGCHTLIREGAKLVEEVAHLLEELPALLGACVDPHQPTLFELSGLAAQPTASVDLSESLANRLALVGYEATAVDLLVARSGDSAADVLSAMLELELLGLVRSVPGGFERT